MAIIYSYPIATPQGSDLLIISRIPTDPDETSNFSVTTDTLATFVTARVNLNFLGDTGTGIVNLDTQNLTISGTTNEIETLATAQTLQIGLPDNVTITNNLTVGGAGNFTGQVTIPLTPNADTDAASKGYVDTAVTGLLDFKGTFRADTGEILSGSNAGSYLYNCPGGAGARVAVSVGDYYIVANAGGNFYCSGDLLNIGDSIFAVADAAVNSSTINDWGIVESDSIEGSGTANTLPIWTDSQVLGNSMLSQNASATQVTVTGNVVANGVVGVDDYVVHNNDSNTKFGFHSDDTFIVQTSGTERLRVSSGGNVGINTSTPQRTLDVNGVILSSNRSGQAFRAEPSTGSGFAVTEFESNNPLYRLRNSSGTDIVKIKSSGDSFFKGGKVAIGTNPGSAQLEIATSESFPAAKITSTNSGGTGLVVEKAAGGSGDIQRWQHTNNNVKAVIDADGNFGIGLSNPLFSVDVFSDKGIRTRRASSTDGFALVALNSLSTPTSACGIYYTNNVGSLILNDTTQSQNVKIQASGDSYIKGGRVGIGDDLTAARSNTELFVKNGNIQLDRPDSGSFGGGIILQTPDKQNRYKLTIDNNGALVIAQV